MSAVCRLTGCRLTASVLTAGCVLALSGCGGGGESDTTAVDAEFYAGSVCTALSSWKQQLESASAVLAQRTSTAKSLKSVRTQFVTFFGGAIDETDDMLAEVEDVGVPDVNDGDKVAAALLRELRLFRPILVTAKAKAQRLPVGNERQFTVQTQGLGTAFQFEVGKLATLFETIGSRYSAPELTTAANADAACREL